MYDSETQQSVVWCWVSQSQPNLHCSIEIRGTGILPVQRFKQARSLFHALQICQDGMLPILSPHSLSELLCQDQIKWVCSNSINDWTNTTTALPNYR